MFDEQGSRTTFVEQGPPVAPPFEGGGGDLNLTPIPTLEPRAHARGATCRADDDALMVPDRSSQRRRNGKGPPPLADIREARRLRSLGHTVREVARRTGRCPEWVMKWGGR